MKLLIRYIIKNNLILLGLFCLLLASIYSIFNFIDNISEMTAHSASFFTIIQYYILASPAIITLLLALLFFLAIVVQITLMVKNKELLALLSAGISLQQIVSIFMIYSIFWAVASFFLTEFSIFSEQKSLELYRYEIRKREKKPPILYDLWFKQSNIILYSKSLRVDTGELENVTVYLSTQNNLTIDAMYIAERAQFVKKSIILKTVKQLGYVQGSFEVFDTYTIPFSIDLQAIQVVNTPIAELSFIEIVRAVYALSGTGVDIEQLYSAIQIRITNALTFIIMTALGLLISLSIANSYIAITVSFLGAILFFLSRQLIQSLSGLGVINPIIAPWVTLGIWAVVCCVMVYRKRKSA